MKVPVTLLPLLLLLISIPTILASPDFYVSTLRTKSLVERHNQVVSILREYAFALSETSSILNRYLYSTELEEISEAWPNDGDLLRTYVLIRRTTVDFDSLIAAIGKHQSLDPVPDIVSLREKRLLPTMDDYEGISSSVIRLQRTYLIQPKDIVAGNLSVDLKPSVKLSAKDCLQLGQRAEELTPVSTPPIDSGLWYQAGLNVLKNEKGDITPDEVNLLEKLHTSLEHVEKIFKNITKFPDQFQNVLSTEILTRPIDAGESKEEIDDLTMRYRRLCRGEQLRTPSMDKDTFCYLRRGPHPYLNLRPLKLEVKNWDPYLVVIHDIIGENDIKTFQEEASRQFHPSKLNGDLQLEGDSVIRLSITTWVKDSAVPIFVKKLDVFLGLSFDMTKDKSEPFQVLNYGVGGHYYPHVDYMHYSDYNENSTQRIATLMLYLSDVQKGGETAFIFANLSLKPIKGAAAFWWNLRTDGTVDIQTVHGACPVIYGTKWVANSFIGMNPQVFRAPCGLNPHDIVKKL